MKLSLLVRQGKQPVELRKSGPVLDFAQVWKPRGERLEMLLFKVLHAADEKGTFGADSLELRAVLPEFVAHVVPLVESHLRKPAPAELAAEWLWLRHLLLLLWR